MKKALLAAYNEALVRGTPQLLADLAVLIDKHVQGPFRYRVTARNFVHSGFSMSFADLLRQMDECCEGLDCPDKSVSF